MDRKEAVQIALERDGGCVCRDWSSYPCQGQLEGDEPVRRSQGGDPLDPDQIQTLCHAHHQLKDNVMRKGAKVLGLNGKAAQDWERFVFFQETPNGDFDEYCEAWLKAWNSEYAYMIGVAGKPSTRYKPDSI